MYESEFVTKNILVGGHRIILRFPRESQSNAIEKVKAIIESNVQTN